MPKISEFYGIAIYMHPKDHNPAHFHASYGGNEIVVSIDPIEVLNGTMPRSQLRIVLGWAEAHQKELRENWYRATQRKPLVRIEPWK